MTSRVVGVVLAGGRSSRMGRDKASLRWGDSTLLDVAMALLKDAGAELVLVAGGPGEGRLADPVKARGPVVGLSAALPHVDDDDVLIVVPVDMPALAVTTLVALRDTVAVAPAAAFAGHPLPWAVRVDRTLRAAVRDVLDASERAASIRGLHRAVAGIEIPVPPAADLRNVNTPDDWSAFLARYPAR